MTLEPIAIDTSETEIKSHGADRVQFSQAVSLKRIADALDDIAALMASPVVNDLGPVGLPDIKAAIDKLQAHAEDVGAGRTTSPEMASLAAKYMGMSDDEMQDMSDGYGVDNRGQLWSDIRSLAASVLSQAGEK